MIINRRAAALLPVSQDLRPDPAWVAEEMALWRALMHVTYKIDSTRKYAPVIRACKIENRKPPGDIISESEAVRRSWKAFQSFISH